MKSELFCLKFKMITQINSIKLNLIHLNILGGQQSKANNPVQLNPYE